MQNRQPFSLPLLGLCGLLLSGGHSSQAQTLSLSPAAAFASSGATVTYTIFLTGGLNLGGFDTNLITEPAYLSFVGTAPFTSASTNPFTTQLSDAVTPDGVLQVAFADLGGAPVDNTGKTTALGTFQVKVLKDLPTTGTPLSFGPVGPARSGGSEVDDAAGANVLKGTTGARLNPPAAIPEASQGTAFGLCLLGLGGLAFTARRRAAQK